MALRYGCEWRINWDTKWSSGLNVLNSSNPKKQIGKGEGGTNEDDEYFDLLPNI